jgi:hypothetical protein
MEIVAQLELYSFYTSPNIIRQIKSKRIMRARQVACMGKKRKTYNVHVGKLEERDHS